MVTKLKISGMTCSHCEMAVRKALDAVPGVERVLDVNKDRGEALIIGSVSSQDLISAVKEQGYKAEIVE